MFLETGSWCFFWVYRCYRCCPRRRRRHHGYRSFSCTAAVAVANAASFFGLLGGLFRGPACRSSARFILVIFFLLHVILLHVLSSSDHKSSGEK